MSEASSAELEVVSKSSIGSFPPLSHLLRWKTSSVLTQLADQVQDDHIVRRVQELGRVLHVLSAKSDRSVEYFHTLKLMDSADFLELLTAPSLLDSIINASFDDGTSLLQLIDDSASIARSLKYGLRPSHDCWAASGKVAWINGCWIRTPMWRDIVIDYRSPTALRPLQQSAFRVAKIGDAESLSIKEIERAVKNVCCALDLLRMSGNEVIDFVCANINVIQLRKDSSFPGKFTSASSRSFIGRALLLNVHAPRCNMAKLCTALIHEALHNFIYRIEWWHPIVLETDTSLNFLVNSPWTGTPLRLQTYIHACFIHYAIFNFLRNGAANTCLPAKDIDALAASAESGFISGAYIRNLALIRKLVDTHVFSQMSELPRTI